MDRPIIFGRLISDVCNNLTGNYWFFGKKSNVKKILIEQSSAFEEEVYDIISSGIMIARDLYGDEVDSSEVRLFSAVVSVIIGIGDGDIL